MSNIIFIYFFFNVLSYTIPVSTTMWFVHRILKRLCFHGERLPTVECVLRSGSKKITVIGWLPCHHSNIGYHLILQKRANTNIFNIASILDMTCTKKKSSLPKFRSPEYEDYKKIAQSSYTDVALWTIAVVYPFWSIKHMNVKSTFQMLTQNIENICKRGQPNAIHLYDPPKAKAAIEKALHQMGEFPYNDWEGFDARMAWQQETRYNTASLNKPSRHVANVQKYKNVWTTSDEIRTSRRIGQQLTPENTDLVLGSLSNESVPPGAVIVVRNLEDAYRVATHLDYKHVDVCMVALPFDLSEKCLELNQMGVPFVRTLPPNTPHIHVAWSHLWGVSDWRTLLERNACKYTLFGRQDQYNHGRGQIFRDMYDSGRYTCQVVQHRLVDQVIERCSDESHSLPDIINDICRRHSTVQCFTDRRVTKYGAIDTGRRCLYKPFRIRTIKQFSHRPSGGHPQFCEERDTGVRRNANSSVVSIKTFNGVHCHACVFLCSEKTTPFDIRVAMSHARDVLYIINCTTCLFALKKVCPPRITVSPF